MVIPTLKIGNFIKTDENSWVNLNSIVEIGRRYEGEDGSNDDDFSVWILLNVTDFWLPNAADQLTARKHGNFYNQMSDQQQRDIFRGTKDDCEKVIESILRG